MREANNIKSIFLIIAGLVYGFAFSQNNNVQVTYNVYRALDIPYKFRSALYTQSNVSIWQELQNTRDLWEERPIAENLKDMKIDREAFKVQASPCLKTDLIKKEILLHGGIMKNWFLVKDNFLEIDWEITSDTKVVAGYNCIKATTTFRGRDWTVWFTPDIPLSFGPWKLRGLPGLIIEAADSSNTYFYIAEKIEPLNDDAIFKSDFATLMPVKNSEPITFEQLLADMKEAEENAFKAFSQKYNVVVTTTEVPRSIREEVKYEWEE